MNFFRVIVGCLLSSLVHANPEGIWCTFDDKTGEKRAHVKIQARDGQLFGTIIQRFLKPGDPQRCVHCPAPFTKQNIQGLEFMWGLRQVAQNEWESGHLIDPRTGYIYRVQLKEEGNELKVRGYLGVSWIGRTQTWTKVTQKDRN